MDYEDRLSSHFDPQSDLAFCRQGDTSAAWILDRRRSSMSRLIKTIRRLEAGCAGFRSPTLRIGNSTAFSVGARCKKHVFKASR